MAWWLKNYVCISYYFLHNNNLHAIINGRTVEKTKKNVNSTTPLRDESTSYSTVLPSNQKYSSNHCDWPPPLYKEKSSKLIKLQNINDLKYCLKIIQIFIFIY